MIESKQLIEKLHLQKHPEGGYFRETYRCKEKITLLPDVYKGERNCSTSIYFLLTSESFSAFHRIHQDEIWHFYTGAPITIHMITFEGTYSFVTLGNDMNGGEVFQFVVPGGCWFGAEVAGQNTYSLLGCTVSPGFDFADFELATRDILLKDYPQHKEIVLKLTRP